MFILLLGQVLNKLGIVYLLTIHRRFADVVGLYRYVSKYKKKKKNSGLPVLMFVLSSAIPKIHITQIRTKSNVDYFQTPRNYPAE